MKALMKYYVRSGLKGSTRIPAFVAQHLRSLHCVEVRFEDWPSLYMDLRMPRAMEWFAGSPWSLCPYEQNEQAVMRRFVRAGMTVYDVGANLGLHAALLSKLIDREGRIVVFEPNPALLPGLRTTVERMGNGTLVSLALSDTDGTSTFFIPSDDTCASLFNWTPQIGLTEDVRTIDIQTVRLDALIESGRLPRPQFMKVDAEGAEEKIFRGAGGLLDSETAPVIMFEALHGHGQDTFAAARCLQAFRSPGYQVFRILSDGELTHFDEIEGNLLAVPRWVAIQ
jgi:FkbM family methyltransferase